MKKIIFLVAALLTVFSGIAAVSAFEGHLVDIKAHVENAIGVSTYELNIGTVFPQESVEGSVKYGLSSSFRGAGNARNSSVLYNLYWELKPIPQGANVAPVYQGSFYQPLNPYLSVDILDGENTDVIDAAAVNTVPASGTVAVLFGHGQLSKTALDGSTGDLCDTFHFTFNVPVFRNWYNTITDPLVHPGPVNVLEPNQYVVVNETICGVTNVPVPQADLGINLKIQVSGFSAHTGSW